MKEARDKGARVFQPVTERGLENPRSFSEHGQECPCSSTKEEFKSRVLEWADRLGVKAHSLYVRPMRRKWASCSTAGNLNFNSELLDLERELGDYVIVHELLHFFVPNHGKLWKSLMRAHLGDYETMAQRLPALPKRD